MECAAAFIGVALVDLIILRQKERNLRISVDVKDVPSEINWSPAATTSTMMDEDDISILSEEGYFDVSPTDSRVLPTGEFVPDLPERLDADMPDVKKICSDADNGTNIANRLSARGGCSRQNCEGNNAVDSGDASPSERRHFQFEPSHRPYRQLGPTETVMDEPQQIAQGGDNNSTLASSFGRNEKGAKTVYDAMRNNAAVSLRSLIRGGRSVRKTLKRKKKNNFYRRWRLAMSKPDPEPPSNAEKTTKASIFQSTTITTTPKSSRQAKSATFFDEQDTSSAPNPNKFRSMLSFWESTANHARSEASRALPTEKTTNVVKTTPTRIHELKLLQDFSAGSIQSWFRRYQRRRLKRSAAILIQKQVRAFLETKRLERRLRERKWPRRDCAEQTNGQKMQNLAKRSQQASYSNPVLRDCFKGTVLTNDRATIFESLVCSSEFVSHHYLEDTVVRDIQQEDFWQTQRVMLQQRSPKWTAL